MTNNDVLRSLRYALELEPATLAAHAAAGGKAIPLRMIAAMLKDEAEPGFTSMSDAELEAVLDGLIISTRGPREGGAEALRERRSNNRILRALRIAFELRDVDIVALMAEAGREVSKAELGALFRREGHRNYQPCGDQFLRAFLRGLGMWHRQGRPRA